MDRAPRHSCSERYELRLSLEHKRRIKWLSEWTNRTGNAVVRVAVDRMYAEEQRKMLVMAGFPDGRVP